MNVVVNGPDIVLIPQCCKVSVGAINSGAYTKSCGCGRSYLHESGIYVTEPNFVEALEKRTGVEKSFSTPILYSFIVRLKRFLFRDKFIGTKVYVEGKDVLDIGSGPDLNLPHLENNHSLAGRFIGLDASLSFCISAKSPFKNKNNKYEFIQGSINTLPFGDNAFDTSIISFTLHHAGKDFKKMIDEVLRVTKGEVIIFDHIVSNNPLKSFIQKTYLYKVDGGEFYPSRDCWDQILIGYKVKNTLITGAIFGHVIKVIISK